MKRFAPVLLILTSLLNPGALAEPASPCLQRTQPGCLP